MAFLLIVLCCVLIWRASDGFEVASSYLGRHLSEGVRGATINAIGSSMPELFTTFWFLFALADEDGFAGGIGTTAGSAIFNGMIIPAVVILAVVGLHQTKRIKVSRKVILRDGISLILAEMLLITIVSGSTLYAWHGLLLMGIYGLYLLMTFKTMQRVVVPPGTPAPPLPVYKVTNPVESLLTLDLAPVFLTKGVTTRRMWTLLLVSVSIIGLACLILVYSCEELGAALGIHYYFVAVIIAAAATSVPDTIISYRDAMRGEYDDAVANALGSNIFDICFALGFPLFVYSSIYGSISMNVAVVHNVSEIRVLLVVLTILAFLIYIIGQYMGRLKALLLLALYLVFTAYILGRAQEVAFVDEIAWYLRFLVGD